MYTCSKLASVWFWNSHRQSWNTRAGKGAKRAVLRGQAPNSTGCGAKLATEMFRVSVGSRCSGLECRVGLSSCALRLMIRECLYSLKLYVGKCMAHRHGPCEMKKVLKLRPSRGCKCCFLAAEEPDFFANDPKCPGKAPWCALTWSPVRVLGSFVPPPPPHSNPALQLADTQP